MNKRGQFFILGAIILALALFVLMARVNTYEEKILLEDFPDLTNNYKIESVNVINDALLNNQNVKTSLDLFTDNYTQYARTIDPNLGFIYVYKDKDGSRIVNYLSSDNHANIFEDPTTPTETIFSASTNSLNDISLNINGFKFKQTIPVKVKNFDASNVEFNTPNNKIYIEVAGIFYPINLGDTGFRYIARSVSGNQIGVDVL